MAKTLKQFLRSVELTEKILQKIKENASKTYSITAIVEKYMSCVEEVINIPTLIFRFKETVKQGYLSNVLDEIILQSKVEFNFEDENEE